MVFEIFKSLHIVGFVAWFGGLFYLGRIFVYHAEAFAKPKPERQTFSKQYELMEKRAYNIICTPAFIITWFFGIGMLALLGSGWFLGNLWIQVKLFLVIGLSVYHLYCNKIIQQLAAGKMPMSSFRFRLFNEIPTLFLLSIVLLAVFKNLINFSLAFVSIFAFGILLYLSTKWYKNYRLKNKKD